MCWIIKITLTFGVHVCLALVSPYLLHQRVSLFCSMSLRRLSVCLRGWWNMPLPHRSCWFPRTGQDQCQGAGHRDGRWHSGEEAVKCGASSRLFRASPGSTPASASFQHRRAAFLNSCMSLAIRYTKRTWAWALQTGLSALGIFAFST